MPRPQPLDVRITVRGIGDLTLAYPLDPDHDRLLHHLHEGGVDKGVIECRMHDNDYSLRDYRGPDGRVRGIALTLARHPYNARRLVLRHWPHSVVAGSHTVPSRMTPEHRAGQEYIARRGEDAGYSVELEKRIADGTRTDVVVRGQHVMAAEVQISGISVAAVVRRSRKATAVGACSTWFAGLSKPAWAFRVPTVHTNERQGMDPRGWTVGTGPRVLEWEHCTPSSRLGGCPDRRTGWCYRWHPLWQPAPGLAVDDIVEQVPAGALVALDTGRRQGVILVRPADRDAWLAETGDPTVPAPRQARDRGLNHADYATSKIRGGILSPPSEPLPPQRHAAQLADVIEPPLHRPRPCPACGRESRAVVHGRCLLCRAHATGKPA